MEDKSLQFPEAVRQTQLVHAFSAILNIRSAAICPRAYRGHSLDEARRPTRAPRENPLRRVERARASLLTSELDSRLAAERTCSHLGGDL